MDYENVFRTSSKNECLFSFFRLPPKRDQKSPHRRCFKLVYLHIVIFYVSISSHQPQARANWACRTYIKAYEKSQIFFRLLLQFQNNNDYAGIVFGVFPVTRLIIISLARFLISSDARERGSLSVTPFPYKKEVTKLLRLPTVVFARGI